MVKNRIIKLVTTICMIAVMMTMACNISYAADIETETPTVIIPGDVYNLSFKYYNDSEKWVDANVQIIFASSYPTLGSGIAISQIPKDSYNWDKYMPIDFWYYTDYSTHESRGKEYGDNLYYYDEIITNGTVLYVIDDIIDPSNGGLNVTFGEWYSEGDGGMDASFTWNLDGTISAFGEYTMTDLTDGTVVVFNYEL